MDKTEYRAVIKFLVLEGQSSKQVEERLTSVYGQSSPSSSTIKRWVKEFQRGRESLEDDPRSGRPTTSTSPENIEKVHKLVIENRRISLYELEEATGISYGSIHNILHDELHMSKVCARWVPKMLSDDMKQSRVTISGAMLTRYNTNPDDFHFRVVTVMKPGCIIMIRRVNRNRWNGNMPLLRRQRSSKPPGPPRRLCRRFFGTAKE